jgi:hypothetical protein
MEYFLVCIYNTHAQPKKRLNWGVWLDNFSGYEKARAKVSLAAMFWDIWKTRNRACFENVLPSDPSDIIYGVLDLSLA